MSILDMLVGRRGRFVGAIGGCMGILAYIDKKYNSLEEPKRKKVDSELKSALKYLGDSNFVQSSAYLSKEITPLSWWQKRSHAETEVAHEEIKKIFVFLQELFKEYKSASDYVRLQMEKIVHDLMQQMDEIYNSVKS